ncbi:MAG: hypothetical protein QXK13_00640 [Fervidicoccaceae archaeon]
MGCFEIEELFQGRKVITEATFCLPGKASGSFRSAISPGLSDAHAHPQVIDVGEKGIWRDSYEWISRRKLRIREGDLRKDPILSSKLASIALKLSALDGVTLIALTGSIYGNILAIRKESLRPRTILFPTVMDREGWISLEEARTIFGSHANLDGGTIKLGIFLHSLGFTRREAVKEAILLSRKSNLPVALHLSEGKKEAFKLKEMLGENTGGLIAVHCLEEPKECRELGLKIVSCPLSNIYLYGRTLTSPDLFDALGSDWPLITGTMRDVLSISTSLFGFSEQLLGKATLGGYELFSIPASNDISLYDESLIDVASGRARPKMVLVNGRETVVEGKLDGIDREEVEKEAREVIEEAFSLYGSDSS